MDRLLACVALLTSNVVSLSRQEGACATMSQNDLQTLPA
jgi:hypothetical protein